MYALLFNLERSFAEKAKQENPAGERGRGGICSHHPEKSSSSHHMTSNAVLFVFLGFLSPHFVRNTKIKNGRESKNILYE